MEIKYDIALDTATKEGCFSIRKQKYIELEGQRTDIGSPERRAFAPGQLAELKEYAPEFESMAKSLWTQEVISTWQTKQAEHNSTIADILETCTVPYFSSL